MYRYGVAAIALSALAVSGIMAQESALRRCYKAQFYLEPVENPNGSILIPEGEPIFDTRLLPTDLWEVTAPMELAGQVVLRPGDQLMTMRSLTPTKCNFPQLRDDSIAVRERICIFDPDRDGVFDQAFSRSRGGATWFAMAWEHPALPVAVAPVAMHRIDSSEFRGGLRVKYSTYHIPLRRRPRDGSPPYYEAFTVAQLYGNDGLDERLNLVGRNPYQGLLDGSMVLVDGLQIRIEAVIAEATRVSYSGNFNREPIKLPYRNSYELRCDTNN